MMGATIQPKHDVLLCSLTKFYADPSRLSVLRQVLTHSHAKTRHAGDAPQQGISLRILDWLVTNYAKKNNIVYVLSDGTTFNMFLEYKSQLKAYSKRFFDPFCRRERLEFADAGGGPPLHTTVGQLNFFRWALLHGVVDYGSAHSRAIEDDMMACIQHRGGAGASNTSVKQKRRELSRAAIKGCTKTHVKVLVRFN